MSKEIKTLLKEARTSISNKDFKTAINICNEVLKLDDKNYMVHILLGAAYQESDKNKAIEFLKKAVTLNQDPVLALQGLLNIAQPKDLPPVIDKLLSLTPEKFPDLHKKISNLFKEESSLLENLLEILKKEMEVDNDVRKLSAQSIICEISIQITNYDDKWITLFEKALESYTSTADPDNCLNEVKVYIKLLYKSKQIEKILEICMRFIEKYPEDLTILEWICKCYIENYDLNHFKNIDISLYSNKLIENNEESLLGLSASGINFFMNGKYQLARDCLEKLNQIKPNWNLILKFLINVYDKLGSFLMIKKILQQLKRNEDPLMVKAIIENNNKNQLVEVIQLCRKLLETSDSNQKNELKYYLIKGLIQNEQYEDAEIMLNNEQSTKDLDKSLIIPLKSLLYRSKQDFNKSLDILLENPQINSSLYYLEIGKVYFELEDYENSLISFIKATKLDVINNECFLWLGKIYYEKSNDIERARKSLEKCINLNPYNKEGIALISLIYNEEGKIELIQNHLNKLFDYIPDDEKGWFYRQSGLNSLAMNSYNDAVNAFRLALRYDDNILNLEGLAEAYTGRGSYNSAMKVFQKIMELEPDNIYIKYQIGKLHLTLMTFNKALEVFEEILNTNNDYFPALKSISETHYGLAQKYHSNNLFGRTRDHIQLCVNYLVKAIQIKSQFSCLWRLLANCLDFIGGYPQNLSYLELPGSLTGHDKELIVLKQNELSELASKCYCRAIKTYQNSSILWYELAANHYKTAIRFENSSKKKLMQLALQTVKNSIKLDPNNWMSWNLFGVICSTDEIKNYKMAQHCFIKAITINKKLYTAWSNLGVLYIIHSDIKLANKAFGMAQQSDPNYINAWAGQAYIAELVDEKDEALDLYRHCTQLGFHPESAIGYAHWVCSIISNPKNLEDPKYKYYIENMHAVPVALDEMFWYLKKEDNEASVESLCLMGYLSFRQKLWNFAVKSFSLAAEKATGLTKDLLLCNLGYSLLKVNQPEESANAFNSVSEANYKSTIGLALAYFKAQQYDASYSIYDSALNSLATTDSEKSFVLIAVSAMLYAFHGADDARNVLFQCLALADPPVEGLFSACTLGILHQDVQLSEVVLKELTKYENNRKYCHHIAFLKSEIILKQENRIRAFKYLQSQVHLMPDHPELRKILSDFLLKHFTKSPKHSTCSSQIAISSMILNLANISKNTSYDVAQSYAMASLALKSVNKKQQHILAQKAVHANPCCKEAWGSLISCKS